MRALRFYKGKKVLVTGHTGFKGTWLCKILVNAGADVTGYSLEAPTNPNLFELSGIENEIKLQKYSRRSFSIWQHSRSYGIHTKIQFTLMKQM